MTRFSYIRSMSLSAAMINDQCCCLNIFPTCFTYFSTDFTTLPWFPSLLQIEYVIHACIGVHSFLSPGFFRNFQGNSLFNNAFRGLDLSSYPLGMVLWQLFSYVSIFSIIHFTLKQLSRMYNPQRKLPTSVQNRFTQISSLQHWFQSIVRTNSTFRHWLQPSIRPISLFPSLDASNFSNLLLPTISKIYHGLSSVVQSISLVFNILPQSILRSISK